ncbi:MAG: GNAT family N-acetyltransferase [Acidimicrobiales bacterium]
MAVRQYSADDFAHYRDIRLESLTADPGSFGSTHEREAAFDEDMWRARLTGLGGRPAATFVDEVDGRAIGTAGVAYTEHDPEPMLIGMWVRPADRGLGSGKRLVEAAVAWAQGRGAAEILLWVVNDNLAAIKLYERSGFVASGRVEALNSNPCSDALEMRLDLGRG